MNETMRKLGAERSAIRELFEYGKKRSAEVGADHVFDFSIGNPSVPTPPEVSAELTRLLRESDPVALHGYTSAQGDPAARRAIAAHLNRTYSAEADPDLIYLTAGAAASLTVSLNAILNAGDEVILLPRSFRNTACLSNARAGGYGSYNPTPKPFCLILKRWRQQSETAPVR